ATIAIDKSNNATRGYFYIAHSGTVEIFEPSGRWVGSIFVTGAFGLGAIAVDGNGNLYINNGQKVNLYNPSWVLQKQIFDSFTNNEFTNNFGSEGMAVDSTGAVWGLGEADSSITTTIGTAAKFEFSSFAEPEIESTFALGEHKKASFSPFAPYPLEVFGS